jgi:GNAT superfamily N-acetyltransferase
MSRLRLEVTDEDDGEVETEVRRALHRFNVESTGIDDGTMLVISLRDDDGALIGGLYGWTWGGSAFVDLFWVAEEHRGKGHGTRLIGAAETEARSRGCGQILLSTHGFQAPEFYAARGYRETGRDVDYPLGSYHLHLAKSLR